MLHGPARCMRLSAALIVDTVSGARKSSTPGVSFRGRHAFDRRIRVLAREEAVLSAIRILDMCYT